MEPKKLNITVAAENVDWLECASAWERLSMNAYVNALIRRDREGATGRRREAIEAFIASRTEAGDE